MISLWVILFQQEIGNLAIRFLWFSVVILSGLGFYLIILSLFIRKSHAQLDRRVTEIKDRVYPLILEYLYEGADKEYVIEGLGQPGFSYLVFEEMIYDMLEQLEGEEELALQELLAHPILHNYHLEQLVDGNDDDKLKSCIYFSQLLTITDDIKKELENVLKSDNLMLMYSAASALMTSKSVSTRANVLAIVSYNSNISPMAVLELCYKFPKTDDDREEEIYWFRRLMRNELIPEKNLAIIMKAAAELGYFELQDDLFELLQNPKRYDITGKLTEAKIYGLTALGDRRVLDEIRSKFAYHLNAEVRQASANSIGELYGIELSDVLLELLEDKEYPVRFSALKALYALDEESAELAVEQIEETFRSDARKILEELDGTD